MRTYPWAGATNPGAGAVKHVPIASLRQNLCDARTHSKTQAREFARSTGSLWLSNSIVANGSRACIQAEVKGVPASSRSPGTRRRGLWFFGQRDRAAKGKIVVRAFLGYGGEPAAAERTRRKCCHSEDKVKYVHLAIKRRQVWTKVEAVYAASGKTLDEMAPEFNAASPKRPFPFASFATGDELVGSDRIAVGKVQP